MAGGLRSIVVRVSDDPTVGHQLASALAAKDFARCGELLDPAVDFRGMTPNRVWEASEPRAVVEEILPAWLEPTDHVDELLAVEAASFADCERVAYSVRGHNDDGPFMFEQQAYYTERDGRIDWIRLLCSGFRPG